MNKTILWKNQSTTILDVGCGTNPEGTTNLDYYTGQTPHHKGSIDPDKIPNFVPGDAHNLPFEKNTFDLVLCNNVLEHLENPLKALTEMRRVGKKTIIRVPNNPCINEHPKHLFSWSQTSFKNILEIVWPNVETSIYTNPKEIKNSRIFNTLSKIPTLGHPITRYLANKVGLEIIGYCSEEPDTYSLLEQIHYFNRTPEAKQ
jgi:ubiquinone/menaquinone biosynthesis C-methylase UbiE